MPAVTLRDIAARTNLAVSTVSRVLNNDHAARVAPERRQEVLRVADELGYVPHRSARALRLNRTFNVGYVLADLEFPLARQRLYGLMSRLAESDYQVSLLDAHHPELLDRRSLRSRSVEGLVWNCCTYSADVDARLLQSHVPIVLVDPFGFGGGCSGSTSLVYADRAAGVLLAMRHLASRGHREVALVSAASNVLRVRGYRAAALHLGLSHDPRLVRLYAYGEADPFGVRSAGYRAAQDLLRSGVPFTAVQAGSDATAAGVVDALREAGRLVPDDVAVTGYDDVEGAGVTLFTKPFLTTVRDPNRDMGAAAGELLVRMVEQGAGPDRVALAPTLVVRSSA